MFAHESFMSFMSVHMVLSCARAHESCPGKTTLGQSAAWSLLASARSLSSWTKPHSWRGWYFPGRTGIKSLIWRPNIICAGDSLTSWSGEFLYWSIALQYASRFSFPLDSVFSMRIRLAVFTAISARELLCGKCALLFLWWTPHVFKNFSRFPDLNYGPLSEEYSLGTPNVIKYSLSLLIRASASNSPVPVGNRLTHPDVMEQENISIVLPSIKSMIPVSSTNIFLNL